MESSRPSDFDLGNVKVEKKKKKKKNEQKESTGENVLYILHAIARVAITIFRRFHHSMENDIHNVLLPLLLYPSPMGYICIVKF